MSVVGLASSTARASSVTLGRGRVLAANASDRRVLIVSGDRQRAGATAEVLAVAGYAAARASFAEAPSAAPTYLPDLVVVDFVSAGRSDAVAIAALQEAPGADVPTVALVGRSDARTRDRARRARISTLISIFTSAENLLTTLDRILRSTDEKRKQLRRNGEGDG